MKGDLCFLGPDPGLTCKLTLQRGPLGCACEWAPSCWGMKCLPVCVLSRFSCVQLFSTLWTVARQDPLSMGFSKQEYWSGLPCPPLGDLPNPGIEPRFLHCRWILYHLNHEGSPKILEWVAYTFSRRLPDPGIQPGPHTL